MALKKDQKKKIIDDIKENIKKQKTTVFIGIKGLKAKDVFSFREQLKKEDCLLSVAKKTLFGIAFKEKKIKLGKSKLEGEVGLVFGFNDEISPAKIANKFAKKNNSLKILGGIFENKFIEKDRVLELALIPSKEELLSKVVGSLNSPISGFVNVLQGNIRGLVYVLNAIKNK
jgi:large subunit ribosomal protein L10